MNLVLSLVNVLLMAVLANRVFHRQPDPLKKFYLPALALKLISGVGLGFTYMYYYKAGDTLSFWQDGVGLAGALMDRPGDAFLFLWDESLVPDLQQQFSHQGPRSLFFTKICGLLALVSGGNYWVMGAWLSLAAFAASWVLFVRLCRFFPGLKAANALVILFFPSVVFWSSGLIKESLGLAALYLMIAIVLAAVRRDPMGVRELVVFSVALWVGWNLKYYWLGIFLPVAVPVVFVAWLVRWKKDLAGYDLGLWLILFLACTAAATNVHPNFYVSRFLEVIYQNNLEFTRLSEPPRLAQYYDLEPEIISVMMNAPAALIAGLFRPFFWEAFNVLSGVAAIENFVIVVLALQALPAIGKVFRAEHRVLILAGLTYALLLVVFLALSTPNFGTLSRYRIGALPILLLICLSPATPMGRWLSARRWFG